MIQHFASLEDKTSMKEDFLKLLSIYYKNPNDVFESIKDREFILYSDSNEIQGFVTFKSHTKNEVCFVYLGVICIIPSKGNVLKILMDQFVEQMNLMRVEIVYTWAITQFFRTQKIFDTWFNGLNNEELKLIHPVINLLGKYGLQDYAMKIENTQFIGKYKDDYVAINKQQNQNSAVYSSIATENERILLIGQLR